MDLDSSRLQAFHALATEGGFTSAARKLAISQPALSQRIAKLEEELGSTLVVRSSGGIRLTSDGERLLRYCQARRSLEEELLQGFSAAVKQPGSGELGGTIRIAGYSSIVRSVLIPALTPLLKANDRVRVEIQSRELAELPGLLRAAEADFIILDREMDAAGIESHFLGTEENVLVTAAEGDVPERFLDHDLEDRTTLEFLQHQGRKPTRLDRMFLDDTYGILDGVRTGWGKAVVSRHLLRKDPDLRIVAGLRPMKNPVVLHHHAQPFYSRLHDAVVAALKRECPARLGNQKAKPT